METQIKLLPNNPNKHKDFAQKATDWYIHSAAINDIRDFDNMKANYDLIAGKLDSDYFNRALNPMELPQTKNDIAVNDEIIPIVLPSFNTLVGEMYKHNIDFRAYVINPEAVREKENWLKKELDKKLQAIIQDESLSEEDIKLKMLEINNWKEYSSQDIRERFANHLLKDHIDRLYFQRETKEGWKDMITNSHEAYEFTVFKNNVGMERVHPLNLQIFGLPENGRIHESEAIVITRYLTVGEIIERYSAELTNDEIERIIHGESTGRVGGGIMMIMDEEIRENSNGTKLIYDGATNTFSTNEERIGQRVMVKTVYFKVLREVKKLSYINEESGEEETMIADDAYDINKDAGEKAKKEYINEYWQQTRILSDIYVDGKRCPVQMRDINNPSKVWAPVVGIMLKTSKKLAKSVVDYLKPIQYDWNVFNKKVKLLWSRNYGKLARIDVSKIPKKYGLDLELFMSWVTSFGIVLEDPFNEGMKGQVSGQFNSPVQTVDMELSSSISNALQYMMYLRELADEMVGVNRQRRGDLMASDGLGTTQESINRSATITEELFQEHHALQRILLQYVLEYAKYVLSEGEDKRMQYITDNGIYMLYEANPEMFKDIDYGIFINNSQRELELEQVFLQLAHAGMQSGLVKLSDIMELHSTSSMAERTAKLKMKEKEAELNQQKAEKEKQQLQLQIEQMAQQREERKYQHEIELQLLKNQGLENVAIINNNGKLDQQDVKSESDQKIQDSVAETERFKAMHNYQIKKHENETKPKK